MREVSVFLGRIKIIPSVCWQDWMCWRVEDSTRTLGGWMRGSCFASLCSIVCFVGSFFLEELPKRQYNEWVCILNHHQHSIASYHIFTTKTGTWTFLQWRSVFLVHINDASSKLTTWTLIHVIPNYQLVMFVRKY